MNNLTSTLEPILDGLARHRRFLIVIYLLMLGFYGLFVAALGAEELERPLGALQYLIPNKENLVAGEPLYVAIFLAGLLLIQGLFLWGGGKLSVDGIPSGRWRLVVPVAITATLLAALLAGLIVTGLEMMDRFEGEGSVRESSEFFSAFLEYFVYDYGAFMILVPVWILWFVIGMYMLRRSDGGTALSRLTGVVLAGSWIEFLVALPVDIAVRQRAEDCPCAVGSWFALFIAIPIFLFAFGPGIVLLYLRELRLAKTHPTRAWFILLQKTRKRADYRS